MRTRSLIALAPLGLLWPVQTLAAGQPTTATAWDVVDHLGAESDVPNMTAALVVTGGPVLLLASIPTLTVYRTSGSGDVNVNVYLYRDGRLLTNVGHLGAAGLSLPPGAVLFGNASRSVIDVPDPGAHVYTMRWETYGEGVTAKAAERTLQAIEMEP